MTFNKYMLLCHYHKATCSLLNVTLSSHLLTQSNAIVGEEKANG